MTIKGLYKGQGAWLLNGYIRVRVHDCKMVIKGSGCMTIEGLYKGQGA